MSVFAKDDFRLFVFTDKQLFSIFHAIKPKRSNLGGQLAARHRRQIRVRGGQ
jgi:hypothetical protein